MDLVAGLVVGLVDFGMDGFVAGSIERKARLSKTLVGSSSSIMEKGKK